MLNSKGRTKTVPLGCNPLPSMIYGGKDLLQKVVSNLRRYKANGMCSNQSEKAVPYPDVIAMPIRLAIPYQKHVFRSLPHVTSHLSDRTFNVSCVPEDQRGSFSEIYPRLGTL